MAALVLGQDDVDRLHQVLEEAITSSSSGTGEWPSILLVVIALLSAIIALAAIAHQRLIAKRRAAHDLSLHLATDEAHLGTVSRILELNARNELEDEKIRNLVRERTPENQSARKDIRNLLNVYEVVCVSIENHVVDEYTIHEYIRSELIFHYEILDEVIKEIVNYSNNKRIYKSLRAVVDRWKKYDEGGMPKPLPLRRLYQELRPW